jgi:hypothetical protein
LTRREDLGSGRRWLGLPVRLRLTSVSEGVEPDELLSSARRGELEGEAGTVESYRFGEEDWIRKTVRKRHFDQL